MSSKGSFVRFWGTEYWSFRNERYSYLVQPKYKEIFEKYMIKGHPVNQMWLTHFADLYWDHKTFTQYKGDMYEHTKSE